MAIITETFTTVADFQDGGYFGQTEAVEPGDIQLVKAGVDILVDEPFIIEEEGT